MERKQIERALLDSLRQEETLRERLAGVKARLHGLRELRRELLARLDKKDRPTGKRGGKVKRAKGNKLVSSCRLRAQGATCKRKNGVARGGR
jgi:hypothetical protein